MILESRKTTFLAGCTCENKVKDCITVHLILVFSTFYSIGYARKKYMYQEAPENIKEKNIVLFSLEKTTFKFK